MTIKKSKIIFEFEKVSDGFTIKTKIKGKISNDYIYGLQKYINSKVDEAKNVKNIRK